MGENIKLLRKRWARISRLEQTIAVLQWDMETYMPEEGVLARSEQLALLSELHHQWLVAEETGRLINNSEKEAEGDYFSDDVSLVRAAKRTYEKSSKIPEELVSRIARTTAKANSIWIKSRAESDFNSFADILSEVIDQNREMAECLGYEENIYDALLDIYEPEMTTSQVETLFDEMKSGLVPLVKGISESGIAPDAGFLKQKFDIEKQEAFGLLVLKDMGYNFKRGRQDRSAHPFTTSFSPYDVRITTRFHEDDLLPALFGSIHECGHALYDQGLPLELDDSPLCQSISLGVHESQSRMWENLVGRSRMFWEHYLPVLKEHFPGQLDDISLDDFYRAINRAEPGLIRVESDEVTYNLHVFIRFDIEKDIINGSLKVKDIPDKWNSMYESYLGVTPPDDANGCLQDIHWAHGAFGYFPTYSIGNLLSAQLYDKAIQDLPTLPEQIGKGDFSGLLAWLREKVHNPGARYTPVELVNAVTGEGIQVKSFMEYLRKKYMGIYGIQKDKITERELVFIAANFKHHQFILDKISLFAILSINVYLKEEERYGKNYKKASGPYERPKSS